MHQVGCLAGGCAGRDAEPGDGTQAFAVRGLGPAGTLASLGVAGRLVGWLMDLAVRAVLAAVGSQRAPLPIIRILSKRVHVHAQRRILTARPSLVQSSPRCCVWLAQFSPPN